MKGMVLAHFAEARIVDLTHETDAHFPAEAGFWLWRAYRYFPQGTTHVAVVDPGVGTERDIVSVVCEGHVFLAPDNGLLAPIAEQPGATIYRLDLGRAAQWGLTNVSATFHGRDIFAPVGARLAGGRLRPDELGPVTDAVVPSWVDDPVVASERITGAVVTVDHFGNLITNITAEHLQRVARPRVEAGSHRFRVLRTYGDVQPGSYLALINSFGVLEIARAEQSAAAGLGLGRGAPVIVVADAEATPGTCPRGDDEHHHETRPGHVHRRRSRAAALARRWCHEQCLVG